MADNDALINDLFAFRIHYMDINNDEHFIIKKLKQKLIELNYRNEELNTILYSFYNYFDIPITLSEIENIQINNYSNIIFIDINTPNIQPIDNIDNNEDDDMPPLVEATTYQSILTMPYMPNLLNILLGINNTMVPFNQVLVEPNNVFNDVVITTDENSINNLNISKILKEQNEKCTICMEEMIENDEYFNINCNHIFHKGCLETYLKNYNHICPVCRQDIGNSQPIL
jgi:hypothetical protein